MNDIDDGKHFDTALDTIRAAGATALRYFNQRDLLTVSNKGPQDFVSEADLQTELLIRERLCAACPGDAFMGEETGLSDIGPNAGVWVVDPIDGTQPFISGLTCWCVSIAFVRGGEIQFGLVYAPARDELFAGGRGHPATLNGERLKPHAGKSLKEGLLGVGHSPRIAPERLTALMLALLKRGAMYHREGSGALGLCYAACGRLIGYIELHINAWDCLAAIAILNATGVRTNDFLAGGGLRNGNPIITGVDGVYDQLISVHRELLSRASPMTS